MQRYQKACSKRHLHVICSLFTTITFKLRFTVPILCAYMCVQYMTTFWKNSIVGGKPDLWQHLSGRPRLTSMDWECAGKVSCFTLKSPALLVHSQGEYYPLQRSLKIHYMVTKVELVSNIACRSLLSLTGSQNNAIKVSIENIPILLLLHGIVAPWIKKLKGSPSGQHFSCNIATQLAQSVYPICSSSYTHARGYLDLKLVFGLIDAPTVFKTRGKSSDAAASKVYVVSGSLSLSRPKWWSTRWDLAFVPLRSCFDAPAHLCTATAASTSCSSVRKSVAEGFWSFCHAYLRAVALWCNHSVVVWTSDL